MSSDNGTKWRCRDCKEWFPPGEFEGQEHLTQVRCQTCQKLRATRVKQQRRKASKKYYTRKTKTRTCKICGHVGDKEVFKKIGRVVLNICLLCAARHKIESLRQAHDVVEAVKLREREKQWGR